MLRKDFGLEVKEVTDAGIVEGYGSTFGGTPDSYGDIVVDGAFADSLKKHAAEGTMPLMLWGHQSGELPIGDWTEMSEDRRGLFVRGKIDLDDPVGQRVHKALQRKSVRGLSIGFEIVERRQDEEKQIRFLEKLDLWEVSVVNFPANRRALVTDVKTIRGAALPTLPAFESFLREAGFSKTEATAIAGKGLSHLLRGEPGDATAADFHSAFLAQFGA